MFNRIRSKLKEIILGAPPVTRPNVQAPVAIKKREPAPVVVYFEKDRNQRLIDRVREVLSAKDIKFQELDVSGDAATKAFVVREAKCEEDDLPVVFVAGCVVGGFNELVEWDVSGKLRTAVFGE